MKYQYNFGFLQEWMAANEEQVKKGAIYQALGTKANNAWKVWLSGERPMPVINMLRFCNTFQVPLAAFFRDAEADECECGAPRKPLPTDCLEPVGGFEENVFGRKRGERACMNPLDVKVIPSVVPGTAYAECRGRDIQNVARANVAVQKAATVVGTMGEANAADMKESERRHNERHDKTLEIIARQQEHIARQQEQLARQQEQIANLTTLLLQAEQRAAAERKA